MFDKRSQQERAELSLAKKREQEKKRTFEDSLRLKRSQEREVLARERAVREQALAEQKTSQAEAEAQRRVASQERGRASAALRHEKFETVKQTIKPYFKPVELGGTALRYVAKGGVQKFYELGNKPNANSPSYDLLYQNFEHQPFTVEQAVQLIAMSRQTSYDDAYNRLKIMKSYGMIKEGV